MHLPLTQWQLMGDDLPECLFDASKTPAFSLPGADALSAFADLIGEDEQEKETVSGERVPYTLGGLFEEDICGCLTLEKEIDFGALDGDRTLLIFSHIAGSGEVLLGEKTIAEFGSDYQESMRLAHDMTGMPCALCVDLTDALHLGRKETLRIRFDEARPAGVIGAAFLCVTQKAHLARISIQPDKNRKTMTVRARICAQQAGRYVLRVQAIPVEASAILPPARETDVTLDAGTEKGMQISLNVDASVFVSGQPYAAPALKIQLFARGNQQKGDGLLCDDALLTCGYGAGAPKAFLPLTRTDCLGDPEQIVKRIKDMGVPAVLLPMPAPDGVYQALTCAGICAVQHVSEEIRSLFTRWPCLTLCDMEHDQQEISPAAAAWQMAGSVAFPRAIDRTMTDEEMILEASGRDMDCGAQNVQEAFAWLRAVQIRLRAEAARQGRYQGALCSAKDWEDEDVMDALRMAFAPVHLSALPLSGAWWTGTRFSASLEAFVTDEMRKGNEIRARAVLEDDEGKELAKFDAPVGRNSYVGVIETGLPDKPCVLTLRCMLVQDERIIEESMLPVYVGERGPLEAAF